MNTLLTQWERDELLDHLLSRPDIWQRNEENESLWLRLSQGEGLCAIHIEEQALPSLTSYPISWSESDTDDYVIELLSSWTEWGRRLRLVSLITENYPECHAPEGMAITILSFEHDGREDPEPAEDALDGVMIPEAWIRLYMTKLWKLNETDPRIDTLSGLIDAWKSGRYRWEAILP